MIQKNIFVKWAHTAGVLLLVSAQILMSSGMVHATSLRRTPSMTRPTIAPHTSPVIVRAPGTSTSTTSPTTTSPTTTAPSITTPTTQLDSTKIFNSLRTNLQSSTQGMKTILGMISTHAVGDKVALNTYFSTEVQKLDAALSTELAKAPQKTPEALGASLNAIVANAMTSLNTVGTPKLQSSAQKTYKKYLTQSQTRIAEKINSSVKLLSNTVPTPTSTPVKPTPVTPTPVKPVDDDCMVGPGMTLPEKCQSTPVKPTPVTPTPVTPTPAPVNGDKLTIVWGPRSGQKNPGRVTNPQFILKGINPASVAVYIDWKLKHSEKFAPYCGADLGESAGGCLGTWDTTKEPAGNKDSTAPQLSNGTHMYTVKALDANGAVLASQSIAYEVGNSTTPVTPTPTPVKPTPVTPTPVTPTPSPVKPTPTPVTPTPVTPTPVTPTPTPVTPTPVVVPPVTNGNVLGLTACAPGTGTDYLVGPTGKYTNPNDVPWESLKAGDTVRFQYNNGTPYKTKFAIVGNGTAAAPIRVCGIKGPNGERPVLDGNGATTRAALDPHFGSTSVYNGDRISDIHQARSLVNIKRSDSASAWDSRPSYIQVDGLNIKGAHTSSTFTNAVGTKLPYAKFGACVWVDRGINISILDNEISNCSMGISTMSKDDGEFAHTTNLRVAGNTISDIGISGSDREHSVYLQAYGNIVEFNVFKPLKAGAGGNSIKDRSVGAVIRYNYIEEGAHAIDLVEAEDSPSQALKDPRYRTDYVYGNVIKINGNNGSIITYGGDHFGSAPGANWGEPLFKKGTLYFWNNTIYGYGSSSRIFRASTTEEKIEAWNNVFAFGPANSNPNMREARELGAAWQPGGIVNLGKNWINSTWSDSDVYHPIPTGAVNGASNMITGSATALPISTTTLAPVAGSAIVNAAQAQPAAVAAYPVQYQISTNGTVTVRSTNGAMDIGAIEL